jgi:hypothetical protein
MKGPSWPPAAQKVTVGHDTDVKATWLETVCGADHREPS